MKRISIDLHSHNLSDSAQFLSHLIPEGLAHDAVDNADNHSVDDEKNLTETGEDLGPVRRVDTRAVSLRINPVAKRVDDKLLRVQDGPGNVADHKEERNGKQDLGLSQIDTL